MSKTLVFIEQNEGQIKRSALELLSAANQMGGETHALLLGSQGANGIDKIKGYCDQVHLCSAPEVDMYLAEAYTQVVQGVVEEIKPEYILASSSALGRDLFPRVAARIKAGVASDCTEMKIEGGLRVTRPLYAGKCFVDVDFGGFETKIILMRPNQLPIKDPAGKSGMVKEVSFSGGSFKAQIKEIVRGSSSALDLTEANIIVSGGRGLKEAANFKMLNELAEVLGATVGASRAVVDAGWVPHSMQVGQTGKTVAPSLYIAVGISGAIQHLAGMSGSKVIVAINSDGNAPIFQKATYGLVGDAFQLVPALTQEFKAALN